MKIETIKKDEQILAKVRYRKWMPLLTNLAFDKLLSITDDKLKNVQLNILGSFRRNRSQSKDLNFTVRTIIKDNKLYVWKEQLQNNGGE